MKKLLALLLCAIMVLGLAACAANVTPAAEDEPQTETAAPQNTESSGSTEKVQITYSYWGLPDEAASIQLVADKFNASQDRIEVTVMAIPNEEYTTKLNTMATAGELPDCGIMNENGVLDFAQKGLLADVSSMYEGAESMPMESITFMSEGKPVAYSAANEILVLYYNKAMFDAAGVAYPSATEPMSWDEFVSTAKLLTLDANGNNATSPNFDVNNIVQYGCVVDNWTWQLEVWALSNGGGWYSKDGKTCTINDPAVIESIQKVADLYLVDHVMPYNAGLEDNGIVRSIVAGNVAMATGGTWNVGTCLSTARDEEGLNYGVARLPYMKNEVTICTAGPQVVFSQGEHQAEAMEFIKWYTQEENNWDSLIATGIWMPMLEKYYTDEALTHKWVDNPNFPDYDSYKAAVVDYALEKAQSTCWYYVPHTNEFNAYLRSVLGPVWTGEQTAEQALTAGYDGLNDIFLGN
jgi:multiple sugar transport system substrate-binding protein